MESYALIPKPFLTVAAIFANSRHFVVLSILHVNRELQKSTSVFIHQTMPDCILNVWLKQEQEAVSR